ncbi:MAG TPA: hypothetical protein VLC47_05715 [Burkholderiales bacterium]|nr:hypothetical protein [Burkholderiales bacterium]
MTKSQIDIVEQKFKSKPLRDRWNAVIPSAGPMVRRRLGASLLIDAPDVPAAGWSL